MIKTESYAALTASSPLAPFEISRRELGPEEVRYGQVPAGRY
jgi:hypothetical protein